MLRFTTAGESHGKPLVAIFEGLPAGLSIDLLAINRELHRRQQGYGRGGRMKIENDQAQLLSGVRHGLTLGSPVALLIENKDWANWSEVMSVTETQTTRGKRASPRSGHKHKAWGGAQRNPRKTRRRKEIKSAERPVAASLRWTFF